MTTSSLRRAQPSRGVAIDRLVGIVLRRASGSRRARARRSARDCRHGRRYGRSAGPSRARPRARSRGRAAAAASISSRVKRVAVGVEQALLGGDDRARAVAVDRAAFEDPVGLGEGQAGARGQPLADVLVAVEIVFAAPAVEAEALRPAVACRVPRTIGPVSRSQMSPNGSTMTSANGASLRALSAAPSWAATSRTVSPLPPAWTASAKAATSRSAGFRSPSHSSGSLGKPIHTASCGAHSGRGRRVSSCARR